MDSSNTPPTIPPQQPQFTEQPSSQPQEQYAPVATEFSPMADSQQAPSRQDATITWSAQEYVHPERSQGWYILFIVAVVAFVAIDLFILKSWTFSALIIVMAIAIIVYIRRPARTMTYALSAAEGLYIGEQFHSFEEFKSFGLITADGNNSIMLVPRKRFSPGVSVFFPEEAGEQIVDILGSRLPMENLKLDAFDIIIRKLRL